MRRAVCAVVVAVCALVLPFLGSGCDVGPVDLEGKACPCVEGYVCNLKTGLCVRGVAVGRDGGSDESSGDEPDPPASPVDAGTSPDVPAPSADAGSDSGVDTSMDASTPDGSPDAGPDPDAGPPPEVDAGAPEPVDLLPHFAEAEASDFEAPFERVSDATASGGAYIVVRDRDSRNDPPDDGHTRFTFSVPHDGLFMVWARVIAPEVPSNSFWVRVDEGPWVLWNDIEQGESWVWDTVHESRMDGDPRVAFILEEGEHVLTIAYRESETRLDEVAITDDFDYEPTGLGE